MCGKARDCSTPNARVPSACIELGVAGFPAWAHVQRGTRRLRTLAAKSDAAGREAGRKLNSSGGGSAAPHGQDGGAQGFLVRVGGWLQRLAASGSSGERRSKVSDYFVIT